MTNIPSLIPGLDLGKLAQVGGATAGLTAAGQAALGTGVAGATNAALNAGRARQRGDVYWIDPNPVAGREMRDRHRFVVVTPSEINKMGISMTVPVTSGGAFARLKGLTVPLMRSDTTGLAVCNQARSFDIQARVLAGSARYVGTLDAATTDEIVNHLASVLDPG